MGFSKLSDREANAALDNHFYSVMRAVHECPAMKTVAKEAAKLMVNYLTAYHEAPRLRSPKWSHVGIGTIRWYPDGEIVWPLYRVGAPDKIIVKRDTSNFEKMKFSVTDFPCIMEGIEALTHKLGNWARHGRVRLNEITADLPQMVVRKILGQNYPEIVFKLRHKNGQPVRPIYPIKL